MMNAQAEQTFATNYWENSMMRIKRMRSMTRMTYVE